MNELAQKTAQLLDTSAPLDIVHAGDPVLRQKAAPYDGQFDQSVLRQLIAKMRDTMEHIDSAVGLAAPQVGLPLRLAVLATPPKLSARLAELGEKPVPFTVLINPSYRPAGRQRAANFEGCLSVPGWQAAVARPSRVRLTWQDESGRRCVKEYDGLGARIVQHETDHVDGMLYLDRAEMRSLSSTEHLVQRWGPAGVAVAAEQMGFPLP